MSMKIAVIGTGIAGNVAARHLCKEHDITVYEAGEHIGGHTHTHDILHGGKHYAIDTGFIVFNDWTYPNFISLLDEIGVASQPTNMGFSCRCETTGIEYNGSSPNQLFAQRRNLFRPRFHQMIRDILRFNRKSRELSTTTSSQWVQPSGRLIRNKCWPSRPVTLCVFLLTTAC